MARIGYARTSTTDQNLAAQIAALRNAGCEVIREEQKSGASLEGRPQLTTILDFIHAGETLVITRIDRLARSLRDLQVIVDRLKGFHHSLRCVARAEAYLERKFGDVYRLQDPRPPLTVEDQRGCLHGWARYTA
nr:recombinase family protein [Sinorhizobium medicae]